MKSFLEMEEYAKEHYVPIARKDMIVYLKDVIKNNNYHTFLEIGSAIGYTAINLAMLDDFKVTTLEKNEEMYKLCLESINDFKVNDKVEALLVDALEYQTDKKFDIIFIDAAKTKNIVLFERYKDNLNDDGLIIIDNIELKDLKRMAKPKKVAFYEQKIEELKEYLATLKDYIVEYNDVGDGIAIIRKK